MSKIKKLYLLLLVSAAMNIGNVHASAAASVDDGTRTSSSSITPQIIELSEFVKQFHGARDAILADVRRTSNAFNKALFEVYPGGYPAFRVVGTDANGYVFSALGLERNTLENPLTTSYSHKEAIKNADSQFKLQELHSAFEQAWNGAFKKIGMLNDEVDKLVKAAGGHMGVGGEEPGIGLPNNLKIQWSNGAIVSLTRADTSAAAAAAPADVDGEQTLTTTPASSSSSSFLTTTITTDEQTLSIHSQAPLLAHSVSCDSRVKRIGDKGSTWLFEMYVPIYLSIKEQGLTIDQYLANKKVQGLEIGEYEYANLLAVDMLLPRFTNDDGTIDTTNFRTDSMGSSMYSNGSND